MGRYAGISAVTLAFICISAGSLSAAVPSDLLTADRVIAFSPHARADLSNALVQYKEYLERGEINTPQRFYHFMAQIAAETGGFRRIDENMNYSSERLLAIFPTRVTPAQAGRLAHKPVNIANHVYGNRLGNRGRQTNDGYDFRGSGFIQLTGRENFNKRGQTVRDFLGAPASSDERQWNLERYPQLARTPKTGLLAAVAYWKGAGCNSKADTNSIKAVRLCVNGGLIGLAHVKMWHGRAKQIFGRASGQMSEIEEAIVAEGVAEEREAVAIIMDKLGYTDGSAEMAEEGAQSAALNSAFESFREDLSLPPAEESIDLTETSAPDAEGIPIDVLYSLSDLLSEAENIAEESALNQEEDDGR